MPVATQGVLPFVGQETGFRDDQPIVAQHSSISGSEAYEVGVALSLEDVALLGSRSELCVDVSPGPESGGTMIFGPATVSVRGLNAVAFDLTLREALNRLEVVIRYRIEEVITGNSPDHLCEDRSTALPLALRLWASDRRGRLRSELESSLALPNPHERLQRSLDELDS